MSTRYEILAAKAGYNQHVDSHRCRAGAGCLSRQAEWDRWMTAAKNWGQEPDDDARQRQQFLSQQKGTSPS